MAKARKHQVSLEATPYYHCTSRCVRQAFLCGFNRHTGKDYQHRRQWVEDRLLLLAQVFCIDVCAYSVMSNHLHVVLHINQSEAETLTNKDVCERWHQLYKGTLLTHKFVQGEALSKAELNAVLVKVEQWRSHLFNISWFMRALNEPIARQANAEDQCKGRFWEGRFTSQALLDEKALLACMAYVDLNPIRAKMAKTPEASDHTSVQKRILSLSNQDTKHTQPNTLLPFTGNVHEQKPQGLPFFKTT